MTLVPFSRAKAIGDAFIALLSQHGISPPAASQFENELLSLTDLFDIWANPGRLQSDAEAEYVLRTAAGVHDFAAKVLNAKDEPDFAGFVPHLQRIGASAFARSSMIQNKRSLLDDTSRKMAELYVACLALHVGHDVELDHPDKSKGDNPDVMFRLDPDDGSPSQMCAIAVKTISSSKGQTIYERIKESAEQINRAPVDCGLIFINTRDALDHGALYKPLSPFSDLAAAENALREQILALMNAAMKNRDPEDWDAVFTGKVLPPVLVLGQSLVLLKGAHGGSIPTPLKMLVSWDVNRAPSAIGDTIAFALNDAMQLRV